MGDKCTTGLATVWRCDALRILSGCGAAKLSSLSLHCAAAGATERMEGDITCTAPLKKRRRDDFASGKEHARHSFDVLSKVAVAVTEMEAERSQSRTHAQAANGTDSPIGMHGPSRSEGGWSGFLGSTGTTTSAPLHPRPLKPPPRFGPPADTTAGLSAPPATAKARWGVSAWLDAQKAAAVSAGSTPSAGISPTGKTNGLPPLPPSATKSSAAAVGLSRRELRQLVARVRNPHLTASLTPIECGLSLCSIATCQAATLAPS